MNCVVLGLGSNRSFNGLNPVELLVKAVSELNKLIKNLVISSVYCTKPMYVENQEDFYNLVVLGTVSDEFSPHGLLQRIHEIEASLGRDRSKEVRFGPRSIDIDIEFFGDFEINTADLEIPHPRLLERAFVLQPLLEILPETSDKLKGEKLNSIWQQFKDSDLIKDESLAGVKLFMDKKSFLQQVEKEVHDGNTDRRSS